MFVIVQFHEIRGRYHCLFKQGFGPLRKVIEYEDQQCLGLFLLELKGYREELLKDNNIATQAYQLRTITSSFSPITPNHATSQSRATQMGFPLGHCTVVTIDHTIAICHGHRLWPHHPYHWHIMAPPSCMLEIFLKQKYNISDLRILYVQMTRFFSHILIIFLFSFFDLVTFIWFAVLKDETKF